MARKYAGPLRRGERSAKVPKFGRKKPRSYQSLKKNKPVYPKQVTKMIKKSVMSMAETKYFNCETMGALTRLNPFNSRSLATSIDVLAFAVGTGEQLDSGSIRVIDYGFIPGTGNPRVTELHMARAFGEGNIDPALRKNKIDGCYVAPSMCKTEWLIEFPQIDTTSSVGDLEQANPMYMRFIRVKPRQRKYSETVINPKGDLFVDQFGESTGVNQSDFNQLELQMYKINRRKYQVVADYSTIMVPSSTISTYAIGTGNTAVTNMSRNGCQLRFTCSHKQPKKLYYTEVDTQGNVNNGAQPEAGQSNELIFIHFCSLGTGGNTSATNDIEVTCKPVSTFKDI